MVEIKEGGVYVGTVVHTVRTNSSGYQQKVSPIVGKRYAYVAMWKYKAATASEPAVFSMMPSGECTSHLPWLWSDNLTDVKEYSAPEKKVISPKSRKVTLELTLAELVEVSNALKHYVNGTGVEWHDGLFSDEEFEFVDVLADKLIQLRNDEQFKAKRSM